MARYAICRTEEEETLDVLRWCDRMLIRLVAKSARCRRTFEGVSGVLIVFLLRFCPRGVFKSATVSKRLDT